MYRLKKRDREREKERQSQKGRQNYTERVRERDTEKERDRKRQRQRKTECVILSQGQERFKKTTKSYKQNLGEKKNKPFQIEHTGS